MTVAAQSTKQSYIMVRFAYGDPANLTFVRRTDWSKDVLNTGDNNSEYSSVPEMFLKLPPLSGFFKEKPIQIFLPLSDPFADWISAGTARPVVHVSVWEFSSSRVDSGVELIAVFRGKATRAVRNPQGKSKMVRIDATNAKARLNVSLGMVAVHHCQNALFGPGCNLVEVSEMATLATIDGKTVTITGLSARADRFWHRGWIEFEGLKIMVREWVSGTSFELVRQPPPEWATKTVKVVGGCDKLVETCRATWDNEDQFNGAGYSVPSYNPTFEKP